MVANRPQRSQKELEYRAWLKRTVLRRENFKCFYCDEPLTYRQATLDHIIPECFGGQLTIDNVACACWNCNHERGNIPANIYLILKMTGGLNRMARN